MTQDMKKPAKKTDPRKSTTEVLPAKTAAGRKMTRTGKSCGTCT